MFDKLIESEPEGADFKKRRGFFMVSTLIVGILFLSAVVIGIYAADYGLGNERIELDALLAPVDMATAEPAPIKPRSLAASTAEQINVPTRRDNVARTDEPTLIPTSISTAPNTSVSRPSGRYIVSLSDSEPGTTGGSGRDPNGTDPTGIAELRTRRQSRGRKRFPIRQRSKIFRRSESRRFNRSASSTVKHFICLSRNTPRPQSRLTHKAV